MNGKFKEKRNLFNLALTYLSGETREIFSDYAKTALDGNLFYSMRINNPSMNVYDLQKFSSLHGVYKKALSDVYTRVTILADHIESKKRELQEVESKVAILVNNDEVSSVMSKQGIVVSANGGNNNNNQDLAQKHSLLESLTERQNDLNDEIEALKGDLRSQALQHDFKMLSFLVQWDLNPAVVPEKMDMLTQHIDELVVGENDASFLHFIFLAVLTTALQKSATMAELAVENRIDAEAIQICVFDSFASYVHRNIEKNAAFVEKTCFVSPQLSRDIKKLQNTKNFNNRDNNLKDVSVLMMPTDFFELFARAYETRSKKRFCVAFDVFASTCRFMKSSMKFLQYVEEKGGILANAFYRFNCRQESLTIKEMTKEMDTLLPEQVLFTGSFFGKIFKEGEYMLCDMPMVKERTEWASDSFIDPVLTRKFQRINDVIVDYNKRIGDASKRETSETLKKHREWQAVLNGLVREKYRELDDDDFLEDFNRHKEDFKQETKKQEKLLQDFKTKEAGLKEAEAQLTVIQDELTETNDEIQVVVVKIGSLKTHVTRKTKNPEDPEELNKRRGELVSLKDELERKKTVLAADVEKRRKETEEARLVFNKNVSVLLLKQKELNGVAMKKRAIFVKAITENAKETQRLLKCVNDRDFPLLFEPETLEDKSSEQKLDLDKRIERKDLTQDKLLGLLTEKQLCKTLATDILNCDFYKLTLGHYDQLYTLLKSDRFALRKTCNFLVKQRVMVTTNQLLRFFAFAGEVIDLKDSFFKELKHDYYSICDYLRSASKQVIHSEITHTLRTRHGCFDEVLLKQRFISLLYDDSDDDFYVFPVGVDKLIKAEHEMKEEEEKKKKSKKLDEYEEDEEDKRYDVTDEKEDTNEGDKDGDDENGESKEQEEVEEEADEDDKKGSSGKEEADPEPETNEYEDGDDDDEEIYLEEEDEEELSVEFPQTDSIKKKGYLLKRLTRYKNKKK